MVARVRRNRIDGDRVNRTISIPRIIEEAVKEQAKKEGHNNFSTTVLHAVIAYLNRENDQRAA